MFVPAMTLDELRREFEKDLEIVNRKVAYTGEKIFKTHKPRGEQCIIHFLDYRSKYNNNWLFRFHVSKNERLCQTLTWFMGKKGMVALCMIYHHKIPYLVYFTGHMFERYCERNKLNLTSSKEIIRSFMNENKSFQIQDMEQFAPGMWEIFCVTSSGGIVLGTADRTKDIYRFNTYLSPDMLKTDQVALRAQLQETSLTYRGMNVE
ncbi:MAG: hypothetical protein HY063_04365 [Bacteroidetes bacterium]|nr:hypothetical protein [Bacteroidota bacterium]